MHPTIEFAGWRVSLQGITPKQAEVLALSANDRTTKEAARELGISPRSVQQRLDDARFKLGMQRSVRALVVEAIKRGILAPLALVLMLGVGHGHQSPVVRRPNVPRTYSQSRVVRKVDEVELTA